MVELHEAKASTPYPYVPALGNDDHLSSQAFVIVCGHAMENDTLLQAIDVCFKAFYVLDIKYPKQCENVWRFQNIIYKMPGGESKMGQLLEARIPACK